MSVDKPLKKKRKADGSHCEAKPKGVQCLEYFIQPGWMDWYAGGRCCNVTWWIHTARVGAGRRA